MITNYSLLGIKSVGASVYYIIRKRIIYIYNRRCAHDALCKVSKEVNLLTIEAENHIYDFRLVCQMASIAGNINSLITQFAWSDTKGAMLSLPCYSISRSESTSDCPGECRGMRKSSISYLVTMNTIDTFIISFSIFFKFF
jgi:hypothetical protein